MLLYMPTYREYLVNENKETYLAPPMDLETFDAYVDAHELERK